MKEVILEGMFALVPPVVPENLSADDSVVNELNWLCPPFEVAIVTGFCNFFP